MHEITKENLYNNYTITNSELQKSNDKIIDGFLKRFKQYEMKEELKNINNNEIISEKVLIPDLILRNEIFNKNECFYECDKINRKNWFPRKVFKLDLNKDNKEENKSFGLKNKKSNENLKSKKNGENLEEKNGSNYYDNSSEEEEEDDDENLDKRSYINFNQSDNNNSQEILSQNLIVNCLFNSDDQSVIFMLNLLNLVNQANVQGGNQNFDFQENPLFTLLKNNMNYPGWKVKLINNEFIQENLTTFDLFEFLTKVIASNLRLDNYFIFNTRANDSFNGGRFYFVLKDYLTQYFKI